MSRNIKFFVLTLLALRCSAYCLPAGDLFTYTISASVFKGGPSAAPAVSYPLYSASSIQRTYDPKYAFDGDLSTGWVSQNSDPQWLSVDYGAARLLNKVTLQWGAVYGSSYRIQVSSDAVSWRDVYSTLSGLGGQESASFASAAVRAVRLYVDRRSSGNGGVEVREMTPDLALAAPDSVPPVSSVQFPSANIVYVDPSQISGTAADALSGVSRVEIRIRKVYGPDPSGDAYWRGPQEQWVVGASSWLPTAVTVLGSSATWQYGQVPAYWTGGSYVVNARAVDGSGNLEVAFSSTPFKVDNWTPAAKISSPAHGAVYGSTAVAISGTDWDDIAGTDRVYVQIQDLGSGDWFDGNAFSLSAPPETPAALASWLTPSATAWVYRSPVPFQPGNTYSLITKSYDKLGNASKASDLVVGQSSVAFSFALLPPPAPSDAAPPVSVVQSPADGSLQKSVAVLSGTAWDALTGVAGVEVRIRRQSDGAYWQPGSQQWTVGVSSWLAASFSVTGASAAWQFSQLPPSWGGAYSVNVRSRDLAGNWEAAFSTSSYTIDNWTPAPVVSVPAQSAVYSSTGLAAGGTAWDDWSGVDRVYVQIQDVASGSWFDGTSGFSLSSAPTTAAVQASLSPSATAWTYGASVPYQPGRSYLMVARQADRLGNVTKSSDLTVGQSSVAYSFAAAPPPPPPPPSGAILPVSVLESPAAGSLQKSVASLSGTAWDALTGIGGVQVRISRQTDGAYWQAGSQQWAVGVSSWLAASFSVNGASAAWQYSQLPPSWGGVYSVNVRSRDLSGNWETAFSTSGYTIDNWTPAPVLSAPSNAAVYSSTSSVAAVRGTAWDDWAGADKVYVQIQDAASGLWFDGSSFSLSAATQTAAVQATWLTPSNTSWVYSAPVPYQPGRSYVATARQVDGLGNVTKTSDLVSNAFSFSGSSSGTAVPPLTSTRSLTIMPGREFAADSFVYQTLADTAPLDSNTTSYVANLQRMISQYYGVAAVNINQYTPAIWIAGPNQPTVQVLVKDWSNPSFTNSALEAKWAAVPLPDNFQPASGTDQEACVYQPSTGKVWEFWLMRKTSATTVNSAGQTVDQWGARWGGRMDNVSTNPGYFLTEGGDWYTTTGAKYGTTATSIAFLGGIITIQEQQNGVIDHAIGIALPETLSYPKWSYPANRTDGSTSGTNAIPEGTVFRLPANLNLDAMTMDPYARMIAKAVQKHGMVVWDKAGTVSFRAENPANKYPDGNPYTKVGGILNCPNGVYQSACWPDSNGRLKGFPWDKLVVLQERMNQ